MQRRPTTCVPVGRALPALPLCPGRAGRPAAKRWCTPGLPRSNEAGRVRTVVDSYARRCIEHDATATDRQSSEGPPLHATIYERYPVAAEGVGAGLSLAPNGQQALRVIGADQVIDSLGLEIPGSIFGDANGNIFTEFAGFPDLPATRVMARADLYAQLRVARRPDGLSSSGFRGQRRRDVVAQRGEGLDPHLATAQAPCPDRDAVHDGDRTQDPAAGMDLPPVRFRHHEPAVLPAEEVGVERREEPWWHDGGARLAVA